MTHDGPKLIEYNVRFGDPEAQTLLPLMDEESDLARIMLACIDGRLHEAHLGFSPKHAVSVVISSVGTQKSMRQGKRSTSFLSPKVCM